MQDGAVTQLDKVFRSAMTDAGSMRGPRSVAISVARRFFVNSESEKVVLSQYDARVAEWFKAPVLKFAEAVSVHPGVCGLVWISGVAQGSRCCAVPSDPV